MWQNPSQIDHHGIPGNKLYILHQYRNWEVLLQMGWALLQILCKILLLQICHYIAFLFDFLSFSIIRSAWLQFTTFIKHCWYFCTRSNLHVHSLSWVLANSMGYIEAGKDTERVGIDWVQRLAPSCGRSAYMFLLLNQITSLLHVVLLISSIIQGAESILMLHWIHSASAQKANAAYNRMYRLWPFLLPSGGK